MITETYHDVEIRYRENDNLWAFELGGREKTADSLRGAKQAIDTAPKEKKKVVRFEAYLVGLGRTTLEKVTVGACTKDYKGRPQFWITDAKGSRSKVEAGALLKISAANDVIAQEVRALTVRVIELQKQREQKVEAMEHVDIPTEDA